MIDTGAVYVSGELRAIETTYQGYRMRSRLEARWAVFLDQAAVRWRYEHEGFELPNGVRYLPDFWLPDLGCFLEIKGQEADGAECEKAALLAAASGHDVFVFDHPEFVAPTSVVSADGIDVDPAQRRGAWGSRYGVGCLGYWDYEDAYWAACGVCGDEPPFVGIWPGQAAMQHRDRPGHTGVLWSGGRILDAAYTAAKSARFEFGESGTVGRRRPSRGLGGVDVDGPYRLCRACEWETPESALTPANPVCGHCSAPLPATV